jgi:hypothetical protein
MHHPGHSPWRRLTNARPRLPPLADPIRHPRTLHVPAPTGPITAKEPAPIAAHATVNMHQPQATKGQHGPITGHQGLNRPIQEPCRSVWTNHRASDGHDGPIIPVRP